MVDTSCKLSKTEGVLGVGRGLAMDTQTTRWTHMAAWEHESLLPRCEQKPKRRLRCQIFVTSCGWEQSQGNRPSYFLFLFCFLNSTRENEWFRQEPFLFSCGIHWRVRTNFQLSESHNTAIIRIKVISLLREQLLSYGTTVCQLGFCQAMQVFFYCFLDINHMLFVFAFCCCGFWVRRCLEKYKTSLLGLFLFGKTCSLTNQGIKTLG